MKEKDILRFIEALTDTTAPVQIVPREQTTHEAHQQIVHEIEEHHTAEQIKRFAEALGQPISEVPASVGMQRFIEVLQ